MEGAVIIKGKASISGYPTLTKALQLLLDMVVRWSSTYKMIHRAELSSLKEHINTFIYELALEERDLDKHRKMDALRLTPEEWNQVDVLIDILTYAYKAQQAFFSENEPTLHNATPALDKLNNAWSVQMNRPKYTQFLDALNTGIKKLATYYNKTSDSDAYVFSMCGMVPGLPNSSYTLVEMEGLAVDDGWGVNDGWEEDGQGDGEQLLPNFSPIFL
ncbi:hypothetical protein K435DRAFT_859114 [Dendrothele bispora CBS 962.96]|uniref:Uncharacterized protein n=1 Tax=Dendrothele bispora (strain CBS 962.96) TaxID=1314807 RepID=A0A4S8M1A0_DENBC|nr:hypothetical protein K435DRAFT_859114 [Dendrothele bispora CBS 962.96]